MYQYNIQIREKQKFINKLTFSNLENEVVGFMYKQTICKPARKDLVFYILLFFIGIKDQKSNNSLLYGIFRDSIDRLDLLNATFSKKGRKLKKGEYLEIIKDIGLETTLRYDVIFLLIEAIVGLSILEIKYKSFFFENPTILVELKLINEIFGDRINLFYTTFSEYIIADDRYDENKGEIYDLGKSVYRTIKMRLNRRLFSPLQNNTEITSIKSESPLLIDFIQSIDPYIITDLWEKYHLAEYITGIYGLIKDNVSFKCEINIGDLIIGYLLWKNTDGKSKKADKDLARIAFEKQKSKFSKKENTLLKELNRTLLGTIDILKSDIDGLKKKYAELERKTNLNKKERGVKNKIQLEIRNLENLEIKIQKKEE